MSHSVSFLHDLANDNPRIFVVRYTGGTKNGVKRLSNDYQKAPVKSAILIDCNQFNYLIINYLFADAKIPENIPQNLVR